MGFESVIPEIRITEVFLATHWSVKVKICHTQMRNFLKGMRLSELFKHFNIVTLGYCIVITFSTCGSTEGSTASLQADLIGVIRQALRSWEHV